MVHILGAKIRRILVKVNDWAEETSRNLLLYNYKIVYLRFRICYYTIQQFLLYNCEVVTIQIHPCKHDYLGKHWKDLDIFSYLWHELCSMHSEQINEKDIVKPLKN